MAQGVSLIGSAVRLPSVTPGNRGESLPAEGGQELGARVALVFAPGAGFPVGLAAGTRRVASSPDRSTG